VTLYTITGTDYKVVSTTSLDSILHPSGPQPAYPSFILWLADVDRLCVAHLGHGALEFRSEERMQESYATGIAPKEMFRHIEQQAAAQTVAGC